ncbi:hypothetical protein O6H91_03G128300 [Diphasiastrum complanatum]|uniref:Uncharacterized protein n=1 Tax=Diphasiastrum complanatum TaxID=34168 RepID=A0ACC2EBG7_DIPCM|nr:hypothetical protein O6H91_Y335700 [Diphasiastrum complanatum]KAJ7285399.1 hypothetical protein O6H91_Y335700 [Diphasiastrum complanatum]KAJ7285400.1 hypothetical protein O6H91_Y335700 [Diphasiastrum complanatum]KAJ7563851.1 hypothetical protein O6H91_03G128300 [Diphasiastrum complanatum]
MGNLLCADGFQKRSIVIILENGEALEYSRKMRAADMMIFYPHHVLCNASLILSKGKTKVLPPHAVLQHGKIYFLVPISKNHDSAFSFSVESERHPLLQEEESSTTELQKAGSVNFAIPREFWELVVTESSKKRKTGAGRNLKQPLKTKVKSWSPALETISEIKASR